MNILINDFNLVIADDYLREYAAFDAHKNKGRRRTPEEESAQVPAANPAAGMMFACA